MYIIPILWQHLLYIFIYNYTSFIFVIKTSLDRFNSLFKDLFTAREKFQLLSNNNRIKIIHYLNKNRTKKFLRFIIFKTIRFQEKFFFPS